MPTFIDRHRAATVSRELRRKLTHEAREGHTDARGVRPTSHWLEDGWLYCVLEAPDVAGVREHHNARGLDSDTVHEMEGLEGRRPTSAEDQEQVRAAIETYWHPEPVIESGSSESHRASPPSATDDSRVGKSGVEEEYLR
jgi:Protein of unknown function (DUF4242)